MFYFKEEITGWNSWGKIYCSTEAFLELVKAIFHKERIIINDGIENLTPGTNAVFKADNYVIKVYAPKESGFDTEGDFRTELAVMAYAQAAGVSLPKVFAHGEFSDKYLFRYLIMEFIKGREANDVFAGYSSAEKEGAVRQLKGLQKKLNQQISNHILNPSGTNNMGFIKMINNSYRETNRSLLNHRMEGLPHNLIKELNDLAEEESFKNCVLVHGDITGENVLISHEGEISSEGEIYLIDFADCCLAPDYYELAPILFELFKWDKEFVQVYMGEEKPSEFLNKVIKSLAIHDFCGNIIKDFCSRNQIALQNLQTIEDLKLLLMTSI